MRTPLAVALALAGPATAAAERAPGGLAAHRPGTGVELAGGAWGTVDFSAYLSLRYLNQRALDPTYTDDAGTTKLLDRRDDLQFQKVMLYFKGWLGVEELTYLSYVWTSNPSQGLGAQVVVAGNLHYKIDEAFVIGAGVGPLPTSRSLRLNFPHWLKVDSRTIADEYFRGSFTGGIWAMGSIAHALHYTAMLGNNLSQLGVDAAQLDMGMNTVSVAAWWTTTNLTARYPFGDLENHERVAASIGVAGSRSREDRESQPGTEAPENSQLRISDGRRIFDAGVFAPGVAITRATYNMAAVDAAIKYRGLSLEGELFYRRLNNLEADGPLPINHLDDHGFQLQASAMILPRALMLYASASVVWGDHGTPWDLGFGLNYYPFGNRVIRVNAEAIAVERSPVGNLSSPLIVGADGVIVVANVEIMF